MENTDNLKRLLKLNEISAINENRQELRNLRADLSKADVEKQKADGRLLIAKGGLDLAKGISDYGDAKATASLLKLQGKNAKREGMQQAQNIRESGEALTSSNLLKIGASGITNTGSNQLVQEKLMRSVEADASQATLQGNLKNIASKFQAKNEKLKGQQALIGGALSAGSSFFGAYKSGAFNG